MGNEPNEYVEQDRYIEGDAVVEKLGPLTLEDGRTIIGCILSFPKGPPDLPLRVALDGSPLALRVRN